MTVNPKVDSHFDNCQLLIHISDFEFEIVISDLKNVLMRVIIGQHMTKFVIRHEIHMGKRFQQYITSHFFCNWFQGEIFDLPQVHWTFFSHTVVCYILIISTARYRTRCVVEILTHMYANVFFLR